MQVQNKYEPLFLNSILNQIYENNFKPNENNSLGNSIFNLNVFTIGTLRLVLRAFFVPLCVRIEKHSNTKNTKEKHKILKGFTLCNF